ncbi:MAG: hypothetical protein U0J65_09020, partial [Christensenellales bacterium]|nr:hypothetical protein [Christensenellales bacterium]
NDVFTRLPLGGRLEKTSFQSRPQSGLRLKRVPFEQKVFDIKQYKQCAALSRPESRQKFQLKHQKTKPERCIRPGFV